MIKAVIFDMDGVVIDSSPVHYEVWNSVFEERFNITIPKQEFALQFGKSGLHFAEYFLEKYNIDINPYELKPIIISRHNESKYKIKLKPGLLSVLKKLNGYKIALATGAPTEIALDVVSRFRIQKYFNFIITGDEVKEAKPNPQIFLKVAEKFNLLPDECIVIEDAVLGIEAAKKANMIVVSVEDEFTKYQDHRLADYKIKSLSELIPIIQRVNNNG